MTQRKACSPPKPRSRAARAEVFAADTTVALHGKRKRASTGPLPDANKRAPGRDPEKSKLAGQKIEARFQKVRAQLLAHPALFAARGTVVGSWRTYRGRRLGPYFSVAYRIQGRQHAIYLGPSETLAERVRRLLDALRRPRCDLRLKRRLIAQSRAALRSVKLELTRQLAAHNIVLKGWEFRGARRWFETRELLRAILPGPGNLLAASLPQKENRRRRS